MKFIVDNALPPALARYLISRGVDAAHVLDLGMSCASDEQIWAYAAEQGAGVITKDADFVLLAKHQPHSVLIWLRVGNCNTKVLLDLIADSWGGIELMLANGVRVVELRQSPKAVK